MSFDAEPLYIAPRMLPRRWGKESTPAWCAGACALGSLVFAAVSICMFAYFALGRRAINALCWLLTLCAASLVVVKLA